MLSQREATLLQKEGENYLLQCQIQQLKRQVKKHHQDLQLYANQLAQALTCMEGGRSIKTDRARAFLLSAQRGLQKIGATDEDQQGTAGSIGSSASCRSSTAPRHTPSADHRSTPRGSHRNAQAPHDPASSKLPSAGEARIADRLTPAQLGKAAYALERERARRLEVEATMNSQAEALQALESRRLDAQAQRDSMRLEIQEWQRELVELETRTVRPHGVTPPGSPAAGEGLKTDTSSASAAGSSAGIPKKNSRESEAASLDVRYVRQQELLLRVLRRNATTQADLTTLEDDLTRRRVIIHNLHQELEQAALQVQQQCLQLQQQQQEQQEHESRQRHERHLQEQQLFEQLRHLQQLLQQQQQELQGCGLDITWQADFGDLTYDGTQIFPPTLLFSSDPGYPRQDDLVPECAVPTEHDAMTRCSWQEEEAGNFPSMDGNVTIQPPKNKDWADGGHAKGELPGAVIWSGQVVTDDGATKNHSLALESNGTKSLAGGNEQCACI